MLTKHIGLPEIVVFIGALLVAINADSLVVFIGAAITAIGALWVSIRQSKFDSELRQKNDEIAKLNHKIANSITGGESFCYLELLRIQDLSEKRMLSVAHQGNYPVYDVEMSIMDKVKYKKLTLGKTKSGYATLDILKAQSDASIHFELGNLPPNSTKPLRNESGNMFIDLSNLDHVEFQVTINTRNGFIYQNLILKKINGDWKKASRVLGHPDRFDDKRLDRSLLIDIEDGFPLNEDGEVNWN